MQIGNQYGIGYQPQTPNKSGGSKVTADSVDNVNPTSVRIGSDAINAIPNQGIDRLALRQSPVQDKSPRQPPPEFDFAKAASSGVNNQTVYDRPSGANRFAIDRYQQIVNGPKREEIQRLVGIDTFA